LNLDSRIKDENGNLVEEVLPIGKSVPGETGMDEVARGVSTHLDNLIQLLDRVGRWSAERWRVLCWGRDGRFSDRGIGFGPRPRGTRRGGGS
jgi:hypothetical protein